MDEEIGVSPHGGADFRTIGDALAAATAIRAAGRSDVPHPAIAAQTDAHRIRISVGPGVYREKLRLSLPGIELVGAGRDETIIAWDDCASRVLPNGERMGTFNSYTVYVGAPDVTGLY